MKRWEALKELQKLIDSDPAVASARPDPRVSLEWFWTTHRFKPLAEARWRKSTLVSMPYIVAKHILPKFGPVPLRDLQRFDFQSHLNHLAKTSSRSLVKKVRTCCTPFWKKPSLASTWTDRPPRGSPFPKKPASPAIGTCRSLKLKPSRKVWKVASVWSFTASLCSVFAPANFSPAPGKMSMGNASGCRPPLTAD
jgi:Phage integrase, N-terminal SAM-like domain